MSKIKVEIAYRTVDDTDDGEHNAAEVVKMLSEGWSLVGATATQYRVHYILKRESDV